MATATPMSRQTSRERSNKSTWQRRTFHIVIWASGVFHRWSILRMIELTKSLLRLSGDAMGKGPPNSARGLRSGGSAVSLDGGAS